MPLSQYDIHRRNLKLGIVEKPKKEVYVIPKVSEKRKIVEKVYKKIKKEMKLESNECELKSPDCTGFMEGADHTQKRSPSNMVNRENLKRSCNACNLYKELHKDWAEANGHFKSRFAK